MPTVKMEIVHVDVFVCVRDTHTHRESIYMCMSVCVCLYVARCIFLVKFVVVCAAFALRRCVGDLCIRISQFELEYLVENGYMLAATLVFVCVLRMRWRSYALRITVVSFTKNSCSLKRALLAIQEMNAYTHDTEYEKKTVLNCAEPNRTELNCVCCVLCAML